MQTLSRRAFLRFCTGAATALGLTAEELLGLRQALAQATGPPVLWLQGAGCSGCTISFLNYVADSPQRSALEIILDDMNLIFHPNLSAAAGQTVVDLIKAADREGGFLLVVEGGIPTAFSGHAGVAWSDRGQEVTILQAVTQLAARSRAIICVGNCASWGGVCAAPPNVAGIRGVQAVTGHPTINVAGCPPHPDWMVWTLAQILQGRRIALDRHGRPKALFRTKVHDRCPLREREESRTFGQRDRCLAELGCRGESTDGDCPTRRWNHGVNWCVGAGAPCLGCTRPDFPKRRLMGSGRR